TSESDLKSGAFLPGTLLPEVQVMAAKKQIKIHQLFHLRLKIYEGNKKGTPTKRWRKKTNGTKNLKQGGGGGGILQWHQYILQTQPLEVALPEALEEWEFSSTCTQDPFPPYLGTAPVKEIYYRPVQMKRGVAVSWDEVEVYEPASKKTKKESALFEEAEKKHEEASDIWSRLSTRELIDVSNYSEASEEREQAGSAGEPPAQEEIPRAKTPEWLVAVDSGFRCLGCCRVFPSLEVLQDHVDNAAREGFSCQVFHRILAWLNDKKKEKEEKEENQCTIM
ncbi:Protein FAM170A, partial [Manis javanica]